MSVPGTYQEKITHLGTSLMKLRGLRSLDLSRNSLVSLEVSLGLFHERKFTTIEIGREYIYGKAIFEVKYLTCMQAAHFCDSIVCHLLS